MISHRLTKRVSPFHEMSRSPLAFRASGFAEGRCHQQSWGCENRGIPRQHPQHLSAPRGTPEDAGQMLYVPKSLVDDLPNCSTTPFHPSWWLGSPEGSPPWCPGHTAPEEAPPMGSTPLGPHPHGTALQGAPLPLTCLPSTVPQADFLEPHLTGLGCMAPASGEAPTAALPPTPPPG